MRSQSRETCTCISSLGHVPRLAWTLGLGLDPGPGSGPGRGDTGHEPLRSLSSRVRSVDSALSHDAPRRATPATNLIRSHPTPSATASLHAPFPPSPRKDSSNPSSYPRLKSQTTYLHCGLSKSLHLLYLFLPRETRQLYTYCFDSTRNILLIKRKNQEAFMKFSLTILPRENKI